MPPTKKTDIKTVKAKASKDDQSPPKSKAKTKKTKSPPKKDPSPEPPKRGRKSAPKADPEDDAKDKVKDDKKLAKTKSQEKNLVKVVTKGGAAVDSLVPGKDQYRVFQDGNKVYSATLNQANMDHNNNKFYMIQILLNEKTNQIYVWNRWGRVGSPGQNCLKGPFPKDTAIREYNSKHHDKTVKGDYR